MLFRIRNYKDVGSVLCMQDLWTNKKYEIILPRLRSRCLRTFSIGGKLSPAAGAKPTHSPLLNPASDDVRRRHGHRRPPRGDSGIAPPRSPSSDIDWGDGRMAAAGAGLRLSCQDVAGAAPPLRRVSTGKCTPPSSSSARRSFRIDRRRRRTRGAAPAADDGRRRAPRARRAVRAMEVPAETP